MPKTNEGQSGKKLKGAAPVGDGARFSVAGDAPLDRRKTSILGTVVYEYIATGEPVGSATLTSKYNLGVSPATVRAEMASLEEEGYLDQPHTSAGRVPSDQGYRYYVDRLMLPESLTSEDAARINTEVRRASRQLDTVVEHASHVLSSVTRNIAFAIAPRLKSQQFKHVQLIWVGPHTVHIVLVTDLGLAAQTTIETEAEVNADLLTRACNILNAKLAGRMVSDVPYSALRELDAETQLPAEVVTVLSQLFAAQSEAALEKRLFAGGAHNLLDQQEFRDLRKLRAILDLLEEQRTLYDLLQRSLVNDGATVSIGHELGNADMNECSVVTVPYRVGAHNVGAVGVLGPRRMQYARLIALMNCMAGSLHTLFEGDALD